ncbi:MAG: type III-B CRISPR-associated protein Cas10/Cmr2 [Candidatus Jordarchaeales archaeon]
MVEGFFKAKILALLHDPPNKPWIISVKCEAHSFDEKVFREKHEQEAAWLVENVLGREMLEFMKGEDFGRIYREADRMAASVDRWLLSAMIGGEARYPVRKVEIKNIFNPSLSFKPKANVDVKGMEKYAARLKSLVDVASGGGEVDLRLLYHLLYSFIEPYFYSVFGEAVGPADTRTPSHSIFDHLAATAMMANWVYGGNDIEGYMVGVDLAGVQGFIAGSRKLRDLWVSSWIASALAWSSVKRLVEELGPDILILPSARNNPFYFHQLLLMVKGKSSQKMDELLKLEKWFGYNHEEGPVYAVVPVTIDLALPRDMVLRELKIVNGEGGVKDKIVEGIKDSYVEAWSRLFGKVKEEVLGDLKDDGGRLYVKVREAFDEAEKLGVHRLPPLMLRVGVVSVAEEVGESERSKPVMYHRIFRRLVDVMRALSSVRVDPAVYLKLTGWTMNKCGEGGYGECTVCGRLPAVLELNRSEYEETVPPKWRVYFDPGEKLCGYCLVKRCAAIKFEAAVDALLGKVGKIKTPDFTSTSDLALKTFKEQLVNLVAERRISADEKFMRALKECVDASMRGVASNREEAIQIPLIVSRREQFRDYYENKITDKNLFEEISMLYALPSGSMIRWARRELRNIVKAVRSLEEGELTVYYAVVKADGDNMGKLLEGCVPVLLDVDEGEYSFAKAVAQYLSKLISEETLARRVEEVFVAVAMGKGEEELAEKMREIRGSVVSSEEAKEIYSVFSMILNDKGLVLSPTYHVTLSRALMVSAIKDKENVRRLGGVTVYAGGDDLLAVIPAREGLRLASETRKDFEGDVKGFHKWESGLVPALSGIGKSYSVVFAHHMHPLYSVIKAAHNYMEEYSKKTVWVEASNATGRKTKKDTCTVVFLSRGSEEGDEAQLSLRFKRHGWTLDKAAEMAERIVKGDFSHSLLRDLLDEENARAVKFLARKKPEAASLVIERIAKRNFTEKREKTDEKLNKVITTLTEALGVMLKREDEVGSELMGEPLSLMIARSASLYLNARFRW